MKPSWNKYNGKVGLHDKTTKAADSFNLVDYVCDTRRSRRLFKRCDTPALPIQNSYYAQAKRLEYDGDIAGALDMFYKALLAEDRVDSCLKDIAGLLNMLGRTTEAVDFLRSHEDKVRNQSGFNNLLSRLEAEVLKDSSSDLPRGVCVTVVDQSLGPVTLKLCDRLFPNPAKIRRILHTDSSGFVAAVHFATHSSARKALQVRKVCGDQVVFSWCSLYTDARLRLLERLESRPELPLSSAQDQVPDHLKTFGWIASIPIYREDDDSLPSLSDEDLSRIDQAAKERAAASCARLYGKDIHQLPADAVTTPSSTDESMTITAQETNMGLAANQNFLTPFVTDVIHPSGVKTRAIIIPLTDDAIPGEWQGFSQSAFLKAERSYTTPVKPRRAPSSHFMTPSPVVEHYLFT